MNIELLKIELLRKALQDAWRKKLNTKLDPANNKWFTEGADGRKNAGLYGGITETAPSNLVFHEDKMHIQKNNIVCTRTLVDNKDGLNPEVDTELSYKYSKTTGFTQQTTNSINKTYGASFSAGFSFASAELSFTAEFGYEMTETNHEESTTEITKTVKLPVRVPKGRVFAAELTAQRDIITVPFSCEIKYSGSTSTWFESRVNGAYYHGMSIGEAFNIIHNNGLAGDESVHFQRNGANGIFTLNGSLVVQDTFNFGTRITDVTEPNDHDLGFFSLPVFPDNELSIKGGKLIAQETV